MAQFICGVTWPDADGYDGFDVATSTQPNLRQAMAWCEQFVADNPQRDCRTATIITKGREHNAAIEDGALTWSARNTN